jgi:hypothetical protein
LQDKFGDISINVDIIESDVIDTPYDEEFSFLHDKNIVTIVSPEKVDISKYQLVFLPEISIVQNKIDKFTLSLIQKAVALDIDVITTHSSDFDLYSESLFMQIANLRIKYNNAELRKENPFSIYSGDYSWGAKIGKVYQYDTKGSDLNTLEVYREVLDHLLTLSEKHDLIGSTGFASNQTKYACQRLLSDIAINSNDGAIFRLENNAAIYVGMLTDDLRKKLPTGFGLNEDTIKAMIDVSMCSGLPFAGKIEDQEKLEAILKDALAKGLAPAGIALASFEELRDDKMRALAFYTDVGDDAYALYHRAFLSYEVDKTLSNVIERLYRSYELGLPCSASTILGFYESHPGCDKLLDEQSIDIDAIIDIAASKGDPRSLLYQASRMNFTT